MLNCCIQQKRKREAIKAELDSGKKAIKKTGDDNDGEEKDSEDEFFDAVEDEDEFEGKIYYLFMLILLLFTYNC